MRFILLAATAIGLLRFGYKFLDLRLANASVSPVVPFVEEVSSVYGAALVLIALLPLIRRVRTLDSRLTQAGSHVGLSVFFSLLHTSANWGSRLALFALAGKRYSYGRMPDRYAMEMPMDLLVYMLFAGGVYVVDSLRAARQREVEAVQLKSRLLEAELRNLRSQLEPHFLFNALNAVSETMYDDPRAADEMVGHLSALLRASLQSSAKQELTLARELEDVGHYVELLRARFRERVEVRFDVPHATHGLAVPSMLLQPLIENAVEHGASAERTLTIVVASRVGEAGLEITVEDDGFGRPATPSPEGIGLGSTRERLRLLYGDAATLVTSHGSNGGFRVMLRLPPRRLDDPTSVQVGA